jgi:hypothetical protein
MAGGHPSALIVIIHAGQVIVNQAVGVKHLHPAGHREAGLHISAAYPAKLQAQGRPYPLAACQQTIAHGLAQAVRPVPVGLEIGIQGPFYAGLIFL